MEVIKTWEGPNGRKASRHYDLMNIKQPKTIKSCDASMEGEARRDGSAGIELFMAEGMSESQEATTRLMEKVCEPKNLLEALRKVKANGGSCGVDGMTTEQLARYLQDNWEKIRQELLEGRYKPQPVRRVAIPKPNGGKRQLGIPTVIDRLNQQAILQVLQAIWEKDFDENSYGFRPRGNTHQAVRRAQEYIKEGYGYVVDIDMEKFFDTVNHDKLMLYVGRRIRDKRVMKLIGQYLRCGAVLGEGVVIETQRGTPQGGPLSPLLSNIYLNELDKELRRRGHRFVRYADDGAPRERTGRLQSWKESETTQMMRAGPSKPVYRNRLQITLSCMDKESL